ncbi:GPCR fungal pheromone mating factor [Cantharellus anzutake]|uniref:GPCR fungal pheromone mating factor n=1 Tax=Cantharellus anzutake TaxID=1750568 RepID=UPI001907D8D4|nr:GPCR fungal pheromone mating factor [Cantharellus anzutake]KAF8331992.1 GPCR fungal pheromone mating factor [Cantharellus anzutake]
MPRYGFTVLSYIAAVLVLMPFQSHWRARNIATIALMAWLFIVNLLQGTGTIIWANTARIVAPIYCDVSNLLRVAGGWALPASALCLTRSLANVASPNYTPTDLDGKRKRFWFEITMCVFMPFVYAGLHYITRENRFHIIEDFGCQVDTYFSWVAIWLVYIPSLTISIISAVHVGIAMYWLTQRRAQRAELFFVSHSGLTTTRYFRLMALGLTEVIIDLGVNLYVFISKISLNPIQPWVSWEYVRHRISTTSQSNDASISPGVKLRLVAMSTIPITTAFAFFMFFAFGEEAVADYKRNWTLVKIYIFQLEPSITPREYRGPTFFLCVPFSREQGFKFAWLTLCLIIEKPRGRC